MLIAILCTISCFMFLCLLAKKIGIGFIGAGAHPLGVFTAIQICIFSMPGVVLVSFLGVSSDRYSGIEQSTLFNVGLWYFYSIFIIFFILFIIIFVFKPFNYQRAVMDAGYLDSSWNSCNLIVLISLVCVILQVTLFSKSPLLFLLSGQTEQAYAARIAMQIDPSSFYPPFIRTFLVFFTTFQAYYVFYAYNRLHKKTFFKTLVVFISIGVAVFQSLYEAQKAPLILFLVGLLFIRYIHKPKIITNAVYFGCIIGIVLLLVSYVLGIDINSALDGVVSRTFLGQNQGFYNIIEHIKPDSKYWFQDLYFAGSLGLNPSRADVDVIPYIYGSRDDIVNVNSYFLGQAWSMFGYLGLIVSPVIVACALGFYLVVLDRLIKIDSKVFVPFMIFFIPSVMLNQSFTYFLYGKYFFLGLINIVIFYIIIRVSSRVKIIR